MSKLIAATLLAFSVTARAAAQDPQFINPPGLAVPRAYTQVVRVDKLLFIAGQAALDDQGKVAGTTMAEQVERAMANLEIALKSQGADMSRVVKTTIYTTSIRDFTAPEVVAIRSRHMGNHKPASTLVEVKQLANPSLLIEIDAIAVIK